MPRNTHVSGKSKHSRADVRAQRDRIIRKRIKRSKREIHPDPVILNLDQDTEINEQAQAQAQAYSNFNSETEGPIIAVHPNEMNTAHFNDKKGITWPFNQAWNQFSNNHVFKRKNKKAAHKKEPRQKAKTSWQKQILEDGDLE